MRLRNLLVLGSICVGIWSLYRYSLADPATDENERHRRADVMRRHGEDLRKRPDVLGLLGSDNEIIVVTDSPATLPTEIEGVPVKTIPPPPTLPPPPGVIVLRPGGKREFLQDADSCPPGFREEPKYHWRFCESLTNPEPIPSEIMTPPIAGIPYEEALKIFNRHTDELEKLPGVSKASLTATGIVVETTQPAVVPGTLDGLPVTTTSPSPEVNRLMSHTDKGSLPVQPLHGGPFIQDLDSLTTATLSGIVLSDGKPWFIASAHLLGRCKQQPPCQVCDPPNVCSIGGVVTNKLNQCPHNQGAPIVYPPGTGNITQVLGNASRWTQMGNRSQSSDNAAGFLDNDNVEGNGSLPVNRQLEKYNYPFPGYEASPMLNDPVTIVGATSDILSGSNFYVSSTAVTTGTGQGSGTSPPNCLGANETSTATHQFTIHGGLKFGDSGALVLDSLGRVIGHANLSNTVETDATFISTVRSVQQYDAWYGLYSVNDNTVGVFDTSDGQWYIDNGNGKWDGCTSGPPTIYSDQCLGAYGISGDTPVTGDWDGNGSITIGVYRENMAGCTPGVQCFLLSNATTLAPPSITFNTGPASIGYRPVVGNWAGSRLGTKVGIFRPSTGDWILDNGDFLFNGCGLSDPCFNTPGSQVGDIPFAGDWFGTGQVGVGYFRPSTGTFYFKSSLTSGAMTDSSHIVNPSTYNTFPLVGNWTGIGTKTMFGLYAYFGVPSKPYPYWYLDNGNQSYPSCTEDQCYPFKPTLTTASALRPVAFGNSMVKSN